MKVLFLDHGLNLELALLLAKAGHKITYHVSPTDKHSRHDCSLMGRGFDTEGVQKVNSYLDLWEQVDMICAPDCHDGEEVDWFRAKGKNVWGAGSLATKLELDRWYAAKVELEAKLPIAGVRRVVGVPNLINELQKQKNEVFVKCSGFREIETFQHHDWESTQAQFIAPLLEAYGTDPELEFVLYQPIEPACEVGADNIIVNGKVSNLTPYGYEDKDASYLGVLTKSLPTCLQKINDAIIPHFMGMSTFFSSEARVVSSGLGYPIDLTCRSAHPPMAGLMCGLGNLANTITQGTAPRTFNGLGYVAVLIGTSEWCNDHPTEITFPSNLRPWVKFAKAYKQGDKYFTVPSTSSFHVQVVGVGATAKIAADVCNYNAEQVKGKDLKFDMHSFEKLLDETIPTGRKYGIEF